MVGCVTETAYVHSTIQTYPENDLTGSETEDLTGHEAVRLCEAVDATYHTLYHDDRPAMWHDMPDRVKKYSCDEAKDILPCR